MKRNARVSKQTIILSIAVAAIAATCIWTQTYAANKKEDQTTARMVCQLIERFHISKSKIDDGSSEKLINRLLKDLDPQKLYFTKADVDGFLKSKNDLDDQIKEGKIDFIYSFWKVYAARVSARVKDAHALIDANFDFTKNETYVTDRKKIDWVGGKEMADRWRKRIKADLLAKLIDGTKTKEARESLHKRYRMLKRAIAETDEVEQLEMYLSALAHTFDPHSSYMSPKTLEDFRIIMRLSLDGIGAELRSEDGVTKVNRIVKGGAADKDGRLKAGDKIIAVDSANDGNWTDIVEMKLSRVVRFIRGKRGTKVGLRVKNAGGDVKAYVLTRQKIELVDDAVRGKVLKAGGKKVGVVDIPSFYRDFDGAQKNVKDFKSAARDVKKVLKQFEDAGGVDAVVIDLRFNGGGALAEAIEVSGLFIDKGPVVQVKGLTGRVRYHSDRDPGTYFDGPLVVLTNRLSASASEIFAGVIKDYGRGIVVGDETTHGKGTVQNVMPVGQQLFRLVGQKDRGALKLTINQFYRVNGHSTQTRGVPSDIVLPSLMDQMDLGEKYLDNALAFDKIAAAEFKPIAGLIDARMVKNLKERSAARVKANTKFAKLLKQIERVKAKKNRKEISLNLADRKKEKEMDDKFKDKDEKKPDADKKEIFPKDHYNDEVLNIVADYIALVNGRKTAGN